VIILASRSARRKKILEGCGVAFDVSVTTVDEVFYQDDPERTVRENALNKALHCHAEFPECHIIAADSVIKWNGRCIGKPATLPEARDFFKMFAGNRHTVLTGMALCVPGESVVLLVDASSVQFRVLNDDQIEQYFALVDPLDKAGAYDIDEEGDLIIESYQGSRTGIMGLAVEVILPWLQRNHLL